MLILLIPGVPEVFKILSCIPANRVRKSPSPASRIDCKETYGD